MVVYVEHQIVIYEVDTGIIRVVTRDAKGRVGKLKDARLAKLTVLTKEKIETAKWIVRDGKLVKKPIYLRPTNQTEAVIQIGLAGDKAGAPTGFGRQLGVLAGALGTRGYQINTYPHKVWPRADWTGDVFISLGELQQFLEMLDRDVAGWVHWLPITSTTLPELFWERLKKVPYVVAMSQFGLQEIATRGYPPERLYYIPHSVDTSVFRPLSPYVRKKTRDEMGLEDIFSLVFVGTNRRRKDIRGLLTAFKIALRDADATDMKLTLKTSLQGEVDIRAVATNLGIASFIEVKDVRMESEVLSKFYAVHDLYVTAAMAEGFGVPMVEAMACGLPVVTGDHTTSRELVGESGSVVTCCGHEKVELYDYKDVMWSVVSPQAMADAIVEHYKFWKQGFKVDRARIRDHILRNYSREVVVGQWEDLIYRVVEENS